jgi:hypothetical protein
VERALLITALLLPVFGGCPKPADPPAAVSLPGPQGAFQRLVRAVQAEDRAALVGCFAAESAMRARLQGPDVDWPRVWSELGGALRGPQDLTIEGDWEAVPVGGTLRGRVHAPVAKGGGVGGLTFQRTDVGWVVLAW